MTTTTPDLVATCWTSAGNVGPLDTSEASPIPVLERVRAVGATGWMGMGLVYDDLLVVQDTIGFAELRRHAHAAGLRHLEVELATGWWRTEDQSWRDKWNLLLEAATELGAAFIKIGTEFGEPVTDLTMFVDPLRSLADEAAAAGTRVALEPLPFGLIASMPQGAELIRAVDHPAAGLLVDYWHVFRAGTSLGELADCLDPSIVFGIELCDARAEVVGTLFEDTRDRRTLVGQGDQDVAGFIRTMRDIGYTGPWGVEILSSEHRQRPLWDALRAAYSTALQAFE
ncbi:hypothetical protein MLP_23570 [Microlunatus phosphovorus NM-1]|uniref:Xylose isomerase-like TIM barrel domain-containing protein n=1 Tax=Microlunatus phosphovorus (strain ATCC 700054 / DSM 10555 / JCM 9379 / NBRC 101784 / NCIMB 13414 / VKM Ac-1990 / NM-1) TaxID=1032480 RepID=F5XFG4_MICPN|nr:sugar phosphate isomerase/epimerase family protein [Microlunatus phosphovorus]BAK35371.1 hypothetical protein MLP_23570 [Microlunatus phosphovorus NM-1]